MSETKGEHVKRVVVTPDDIVTSREKSNPSSESLISDERIRQILQRFAPILHKGVAESETFISRSVGDRLADTTVMLKDEIELWDALFGLRHVISEKVKQGKLYVPEVIADDSNLLAPPAGTQEPENYSKELKVAGSAGKQFRVNLDRVVWTSILPFNPNNMRFFIKPYAHLGGQLGIPYGEEALYNAFMGIEIYLQDALGRWVVEQMPNHPVFNPIKPVDSYVWFNTTIDRSKPNTLSISINQPAHLNLHCNINHPDQLSSLKIPKKQRLRLFFWQLERFMRPISIDGQTRPALLGSAS